MSRNKKKSKSKKLKGAYGITVIKSSGEKEKFSEKKFIRSLSNAGASQKAIEEVIRNLNVSGEVTSKELYKQAIKHLKKVERPTAGRYNLKSSLFEFGPSGYPFEDFVGEIFKEMGYKVEVGVPVMGKCVSHEVDVVGHSNDTHIMVECKFHNRPGLYTSVKIPLYVNSRFDDLNDCPPKDKECHFHKGYVVTNTRFSYDAEAYAHCKGLELLAWNYPRDNGISSLIDKYGLHPVTCLTTLSKKSARLLLKRGVVTCRELTKQSLRGLGLNAEKVEQVLNEARSICGRKNEEAST